MTNDLRKPCGRRVARRLSALKEYFTDAREVRRILSRSDPIIYEVYEHPAPGKGAHLVCAVTVLYPGRVGSERYFTKGHFHCNPDAAEAIIGIAGTGLVLLRDRNKRLEQRRIKPRALVYSRPGQAHRVVNNSSRKLVFLSICRADIRHDYETILKTGFRRIR